MIKKFKKFFSSDVQKEDVHEEETQEELNLKLMSAIKNADYYTFLDVLEKGADVNMNVHEHNRFDSPLITCIYGWGYGPRDQARFFKTLIDYGVKLFGNMVDGPNGIYEIDVYSAISHLVEPNWRKEMISYILDKYPNYMEERELRETSNKYNL